MSKTTRRSFRSYRYEEADTFATYLSEMAAQGWYLKKFGFGMQFEQGEPSRTVYDVQVFPKGRETDLRPEDEAMEMAEYCEKAGWQLVDGTRKFVVFRQIDPDAVPIVTPEEKCENIRLGTMKSIKSQLPSYLALLFAIVVQYIGEGPAIFLFSSFYQLILLLNVIYIISTLLRLIHVTRKFRIFRAEIESGNTPFYGTLTGDGHTKPVTRTMVLELISWVIVCLAVLFSVSDPNIGLAALIAMIILPPAIILIDEFRPDRSSRPGIIAILTIVLMTVPIAAVIIEPFHGTESSAGTGSSNRISDIPLQAEDYITDSSLTLCNKDVTEYESGLGTIYQADLDYNDYDISLEYDIMTCRYSWATDMIWSYENQEIEDELSDPDILATINLSREFYQSSDLSEKLDEEERNTLWNADETMTCWDVWYIRKGNTVIRIEFSTLPNAEQIRKISAKLGL